MLRLAGTGDFTNTNILIGTANTRFKNPDFDIGGFDYFRGRMIDNPYFLLA